MAGLGVEVGGRKVASTVRESSKMDGSRHVMVICITRSAL